MERSVIDGRQIFRQYEKFNGETFLDYLKKVHKKFAKLYLFLDKARQHHKTKIVTDYLRREQEDAQSQMDPDSFSGVRHDGGVLEGRRKGSVQASSVSDDTGGAEIYPCKVLSNEKVLLTSRHEEVPPDQQVFMNL